MQATGTHETAAGRAGAPARRRAWLELLRAPNLLTVPGDPAAGALLAGAGAAAWPAVATACAAALALYASGLLLNDVADREEDRRDRPGRPLPSGRVSVRAARRAACFAWGLGVACAWAASRAAGAVALVLGAALVAYDLGAKRTAAGPWLMGACRGLSVLLGAAAAVGPRIGPAPAAGALAVALYVAAVTAAARREMDPGRPPRGAAAPLLAAAAGAGLALAFVPPARGVAALAWLPALAAAGAGSRRWARADTPRPEVVGRWLGNLPWLQAALAASSGRVPEGPVLAAALACAWWFHRVLSRRVAAS